MAKYELLRIITSFYFSALYCVSGLQISYGYEKEKSYVLNISVYFIIFLQVGYNAHKLVNNYTYNIINRLIPYAQGNDSTSTPYKIHQCSKKDMKLN